MVGRMEGVRAVDYLVAGLQVLKECLARDLGFANLVSSLSSGRRASHIRCGGRHWGGGVWQTERNAARTGREPLDASPLTRHIRTAVSEKDAAPLSWAEELKARRAFPTPYRRALFLF